MNAKSHAEQLRAKGAEMAAKLTDEALCIAWMATEGATVTEELATTRGWMLDELHSRLGDVLFDEWLVAVDDNGETLNPLNYFGRKAMTEIEIGVRVSGEIAGQSFTGVVRSVGRTGGRSAVAADGTFTTVELGTLDSVTVETDNELSTPSGRKVRRAHVTGAQALGALRIL